MQHTSSVGAVVRSASTGLCLLALGAAASAQAVSAGKTSFAPAQGAMAAGGPMTNGFTAKMDGSVGQPAVGELATSASYKLETGVAWIIEAPTNGPVITGVLEGSAEKHGGDVVTVAGFNFAEVGSGSLSVSFNGVTSGNVHVLSNLHAIAVTPPGMDAATNPLALVDVTASNSLGSDGAIDALDYVPSLVEDGQTRVGGPMRIRFHHEPGKLLALALGKSVPGFSVVIPPWDGAFQVLLNVQLLINFIPVPTGVHTFQVNVPNDPNLVGGTLEFQAFSGGNLGAGEGALTNLLKITFLP